MALSNMDKDVVTRLMKMISTSDQQMNNLKRDYAAYAKLTMLASQMHMLQEQAKGILQECELNARLQSIAMNADKIPGTIYYLYTQNTKEVLSRISPQEWNSYETYHGAFLYDFDHTFRICWKSLS